MVYDVCLKMGDGGEDVIDFYCDLKFIGYIYVGFYFVLDGVVCFVVCDDDGVLGYVVGCLDMWVFE